MSKSGAAAAAAKFILHQKYRQSSLAAALEQSKAQLIFSGGLEFDFLPAPSTGTLYVTEALMLLQTWDDLRPALLALKKQTKPLVVAHVTRLTEPRFSALQIFIATEFCISVVPVSSEDELVRLLVRLNRPPYTPVSTRPVGSGGDADLRSAVDTVPGLKDGTRVLSTFRSLGALACASVDSLKTVTGAGNAAATRLASFFADPLPSLPVADSKRLKRDPSL